ncbi:DNA-entry nuclease [Lachnospiraceae bacterium]|nr:DNA-entry nuclease [Lachnospiraceae bacterium]
MSQRKEERKHKMRIFIALLIVLLVVVSFVFLCYKTPLGDFIKSKIGKQEEKPAGVVSEIPEFDDVPYVELNGNIPLFTDEEKITSAFEKYSELDDLGRCGVAYANICKDIMPEEEREDISSVYPTGWINNEYDIVDQKFLYNRCHLIGFQLAGENANERNLITGTRYMNVEGMLPFEDEVAMYVYRTNNHVLYRVTPFFDGDNLVANGVELEAYSVEDNGAGVCFNVYVYNVQPGIEIDYKTGDNWKGKDYEKYQ